MTPGGLGAPPDVVWIVRTLEAEGYETWAVGGSVRDAVAGRPSGDWDLATRARPADVRRIFRRTVPLGVEHGTVGVLSASGTMYEVTTFRRDVETDGRHAVVAFADDVRDDLSRRDFTINAMAWHPLRGELLDPHGGARDLEAGVLRTVGSPEERFAEDHLRVLRALRFASLFGLTVDASTWEALRADVPSLPELSAERIRDELLKTLSADPRPSAALELWVASGAVAALLPELAERTVGAAWARTRAAVDALPRGRPLLRLAALLHVVAPEPAAALLLRLRLSNAQTDAVARWALAPPPPAASRPAAEVRRWLSRVGREHARPAVRLALARARAGDGDPPAAVAAAWLRAREVLAADPALEVGELAIDGRDLIGMGLRPGPRFGTILDALLERVLDDPSLNRPAPLRELAAALATEEGEAPGGPRSG